jgi:hypothetical protein
MGLVRTCTDASTTHDTNHRLQTQPLVQQAVDGFSTEATHAWLQINSATPADHCTPTLLHIVG